MSNQRQMYDLIIDPNQEGTFIDDLDANDLFIVVQAAEDSFEETLKSILRKHRRSKINE